MNKQIWWYLARSSGMVAAVLLVASFIWGVLMATRALKPIDRPAWMLAMHRWFSGLAVTATALHLVGLVADSYVHFGAKEILVPMTSTWKPVAVTLGVLSMYILATVQITSMMMKRLPRRVWRGIHYSSYALVWLVFIHAGLSGSDTSNRAYRIIALILAIVVTTVAMLRIRLGKYSAARRDKRDAPPAGRPLPPPSGSPVGGGGGGGSGPSLGDPLIGSRADARH